MWIAVKLIIMGVVFVIRFFGSPLARIFRGVKPHSFEGVDFKVQTLSSKSGVFGKVLIFPLKSSFLFRLTPETFMDRFFKRIGLSQEFQTGHNKFDQRFYIASDDSRFCAQLKLSGELRSLIDRLYETRCRSITANGSELLIQFDGNPDVESLSAMSTKFYRQIQALAQQPRHFFEEPQFLRILFVECFIWAMAAYGATGFVTSILTSWSIYFNTTDLYIAGSLFGLALFITLMLLIRAFLRGSSRSHRILSEAAVALFIGLPLGGIHLLSDLNINLPQEMREARAVVEAKQTRESRGRRGTVHYSYFLLLQPDPGTPIIDRLPRPIWIQVPLDTYNNGTQGRPLVLNVGPGALGLPWMKSLTFL